MNRRENQSNTHIRIWIPKVKEGKQKEEVKQEARIVITMNDEEMIWAKKGFIMSITYICYMILWLMKELHQ